jgi:uncharacterized protein involved in exopolysaccharide biosynthesis
LNNEKAQFDIRSYWAILGRRKTLLILPLMIVPLVAFAASYFIKPSFVSSVSILLNETRVLPTTVEQDVEGRAGYNYQITTQERQTAIFNQMTSTNYLRRIIAVLDLPITDDIKKQVSITKANYPEISESDLAENILADQLRQKVIVNMRSSNLIDLSFSAQDPVNAQKRAAALADIFIEENLAAELKGVRSSIAFSEDQLSFYKEKLKNAEEKLREFRQSMFASTFGQDTSSSNIQEISAAVQALDLDISNQQDQQANLRTSLDNENFDVSTLTLPPQIESMKDKLLGNASKLSDLLTNFTWRDASILSINEESRSLIDNMTTEIKTWVNQRYADSPQYLKDIIVEYQAGNVVIDFNRAKRATLDKYISQTKIKLGEDPATEVTMKRLQSEIDSYKRFYDLFVSHSQNAAINQSAKKVEAEAKYTIIKPASLPLSPDSPKRGNIFGMGLAIGLAIGLGGIMMVELLDNSFKKVEDVTAFLNLPVIGTIPRIDIPFTDTSKRRIPMIIGVGLSFFLIIFILYLNFRKNG